MLYEAIFYDNYLHWFANEYLWFKTEPQENDTDI